MCCPQYTTHLIHCTVIPVHAVEDNNRHPLAQRCKGTVQEDWKQEDPRHQSMGDLCCIQLLGCRCGGYSQTHNRGPIVHQLILQSGKCCQDQWPAAGRAQSTSCQYTSSPQTPLYRSVRHADHMFQAAGATPWHQVKLTWYSLLMMCLKC